MSALPTAQKAETEHPSFELVAVCQTPDVNPGDAVRINLFIYGYGDVSNTKLSLNYNYPNVINKDNPGNIKSSISGTVDKQSNTIPEIYTGEPYFESRNEDEYKIELDSVGSTSYVPLILLADDERWDPQLHPKAAIEDYPRIISEKSHDGWPPVQLTLNTSPEAKVGDCYVRFIFTYGDERVQQSIEEATFHVNSKREELEPYPSIAAIGGAVIGLVSLAAQASVVAIGVGVVLAVFVLAVIEPGLR